MNSAVYLLVWVFSGAGPHTIRADTLPTAEIAFSSSEECSLAGHSISPSAAHAYYVFWQCMEGKEQ
jgi:hypothetical protein